MTMKLPNTDNLLLINGTKLDYYLSLGYYRIGRVLFTTNHICIDDENLIDVFWIRTNLAKLQFGSTTKKIVGLAKNFSIQVKPAAITDEINQLYSLYKGSINFSHSESVQGYLFGAEPMYQFETYMVEVRDNNQLVAVGYFDNGLHSIAGILNFYHPNYKKYSLGKLLMITKLQHAINADLHYYYTGYIALQNPKFDYKIFPNSHAIEVFVPFLKNWFPYHLLQKEGLENLTKHQIT